MSDRLEGRSRLLMKQFSFLSAHALAAFLPAGISLLVATKQRILSIIFSPRKSVSQPGCYE